MRRQPRTPLLLAAAIAAAVVAPCIGPVEQAAATSPRVITIGESADARQRLELLRSFDASGPDEVAIVTLADAAPLDDLFGGSEGVWSSTVLACEAPGAGLTIDASDIAGAPPALFALALSPAGLTDASLRVAAPADAPQEPVAAFAGLFKTWGAVPCATSDADGSGRQLALGAVALATEIGAAISPDDPAAGVEAASLLILRAQGAAVADPDHLATALAVQERSAGITLPAAARTRVGDLLERTVSHDWGAHAGGWTVETANTDAGLGIRFAAPPVSATTDAAAPAATAIAPAADAIGAAQHAAAEVGGGIADLASAALNGAADAEATATAEADRIRDLSAAITPAALPAQPDPAPAIETPAPATPAPPTPVPTLTAAEIAATQVAAQDIADSRATEAALATAAADRAATATAEAGAMLAAAEAPTPTPEPVLSAAAVEIDGTLVEAGAGRVTIAQPGQPQAAFRLAQDVALARDGAAGALTDLSPGDRVRLTIDGRTGLVVALRAEPAAPPLPTLPLVGLALVPALLVGLILNRRRQAEPFVVVHRPIAVG